MLSGTGGTASPGYLLLSFVAICLRQQECWVASPCIYLNVLSLGWSAGGRSHLLGSPHTGSSWSAQCQVGETQCCTALGPARPITAETSAQWRLVPTCREEPRGTVATPSALGWVPGLSQCSHRSCGLGAMLVTMGRWQLLSGACLGMQGQSIWGLYQTYQGKKQSRKRGISMVWDQRFTTTIIYFFSMCKSKDFSAKKFCLAVCLYCNK